MKRRYKNIEKALIRIVNKPVSIKLENAKYKLSKTLDLRKYVDNDSVEFVANNCWFIGRTTLEIGIRMR